MAKRNLVAELEEFEAETANGLVMTTEKILQVIPYCTGDLRKRAEDALLGQVRLARRLSNKPMLKALAERLNAIQFHSHHWISEMVHHLPTPKPRAVSGDPQGPSRDIRKGTHPSIVSITRMEGGSRTEERTEEDLLKPSSGEEDMEVTAADDAILTDTIPTKPVSPVKPRMQMVIEGASACPAPNPGQVEVESTPVAPSTEHIRDYSAPKPEHRRHHGRGPAPKPEQEAQSSKHESRRHYGRGPAPKPEQAAQSSKGSYSRLKEQHAPRDMRREHPSGRREQRYEHSRRSRERRERSESGEQAKRPRVAESNAASRDHHDRQRQSGSKFDHRDHDKLRQSGPKSDKKKAKRGWSGPRCPITGCEEGLSMKHTFNSHLPLLFHPNLSGKDISARRRTALVFLQRVLVGAHKTLSDLIRLADNTDQTPGDHNLSPELIAGMTEFCVETGIPVPEKWCIRPRGNSETMLLHWSKLLALVSLLRKEEQEDFRELFQPSPEELAQLPIPVQGFDAHCHLDRTMAKFGIEQMSLETINQAAVCNPEYEVDTRRVVAVFCDPDTYPTEEEMSSWITQGAVIAIGWHPRTSGTEEDWQRFTTLMSSPKVTALGEIGLDRTEHPDTWFTQMLNMERALSTLGPKHVLVLHSRSLNDTQTPDESWFTILQILKNHPKVGRGRLVHCHCFTGTQALTLRWLQEFPNTYFGYTNLVRKFSEKDDPEKLESIRRMEPGRMLLETDAPYFGTGGVRRTTPALLGYAALEVGRIRNEPWKDLLRRCSENAYRLYVQGQSPEL